MPLAAAYYWLIAHIIRYLFFIQLIIREENMNIVAINSLFQLSHPLKYLFCACRHYTFSVYLFHACRQCTIDMLPFQSCWFSKQSVLQLWCRQVALLIFSEFRITDCKQPGSNVSHFTKPKSDAAFLKPQMLSVACLTHGLGVNCSVCVWWPALEYGCLECFEWRNGPPDVKAILRDMQLCIFYSRNSKLWKAFTMYKNR